MTDHRRQSFVACLFFCIILNVACSGFFQVYWLKDNQWALDPRDLSIRWLSDADYQAMEKTTGTEYTTSSGSTWALTPDPEGRKAFLSLHQIGTPDGRWHGWVATRLASHTLHTWLGSSIPALVLSMMGLIVCLRGFQKKAPADERD